MESEPRRPVDDPRIYLAAERTYLAWVRTSLGLMGFGFLIARFGYLMRQLEAIDPEHARRSPYSSWLGGAMVTFGIGVCITAVVRHLGYVRDLRAGASNPRLSMWTPVVVAVVLALAGLAMAVLILTY